MTSRFSDLGRPPLREDALTRALAREGSPWRRVSVVPQTASTNADLAAAAAAGTARPGDVLTTDDQTGGRGRLTRTWSTPPRAAIAVSVLLRPEAVPAGRWSWLPLLAGVAVADSLRAVAGVDAALKWPNDVLLPLDAGRARGRSTDWRKVCGVLAEVVTTPQGPAVVVGIGLNVSQDESELPVATATSLLLAGAATADRDTLLRSLLRALGTRYDAWVAAEGDPRSSGLGAAYREACLTLGQDVRVALPGGDALEGRAEGVDDEGRLLVSEGGAAEPRPLAAGDVVHVRPAPGRARPDAP